MKFLRIIFCAIPCLFWLGGAVARAEQSIARLWNEQNLNAIRGDSPHPPVHARNLFHLSIAMYDAWAAYDPVASGYVYREKHTAADVASARREAISYAAYRILLERYSLSRTAGATLIALSARMASLGYDRNNLSLDPSEPAGVGNAVAARVSSHFLEDGVRQAQGYLDVPANRGGYAPINPPLVTASSGAIVVDVNRWQPLAIDNALDQNGFPIGPVQIFLGSQCLNVWSFALTRSEPGKPWIDPGPPPRLGGNEDARFRAEVVDIIRRGSQMSPDDGVFLDISPGKYGNNTLGANDGVGHAINPATGLPYPANRVKRADFVRVLAEFWADGPHSETPPGHWNVIANAVSDRAKSSGRMGGTGPVLDALEWDVKLYFALNAALHDAACAAWSLKRHYDGGRPIQFIRYMGQLGQSTRTNDASYHPLGLPLIPGLIEQVNLFTAQRGGRHAGLAPGSIAVLGWPGQPLDITNQYSGVRWVAAADWIPYQKKTFVTPAFPGYISGHSTFSRAGAELLAEFTGSPFFPDGLGTYTVPAHTGLTFEKGPTEPVTLQWGTYFDAADQAGISRLWGGIHVSADDLNGRRVGAECGRRAWELARQLFEGSKQIPLPGGSPAVPRRVSSVQQSSTEDEASGPQADRGPTSHPTAGDPLPTPTRPARRATRRRSLGKVSADRFSAHGFHQPTSGRPPLRMFSHLRVTV